MNKLSVALLVALSGVSVSQAADVVVSPGTAPWLGYMNVFELPANGGGFVFGSPWGVADVVSVFDDANSKLTLKVNSINDPNAFWYTPGGQAGAAGNKTMDANTYQEATDIYNGQTLTFSGEVLSNTLSSTHQIYVFIKDFAPDFSSYNSNIVPLGTGNFSVSLDCDAQAGRHVQWGFEMIGPCVWITDSDLFGNVVVKTDAGCTADFNGDGFLDFTDFDDFVTAFEAGAPSGDFNGDGFLDFTDFDAFVGAFEAGC
jgi:hypothetical protein